MAAPEYTPDDFSAQTAYAGTLFRSRIEARWAVFFDCLHLRWLYEPYMVSIEAYEKPLPEDSADPLRYPWITPYRGWAVYPTDYTDWPYSKVGTPKYVPDFYLPDLRLWVEVKNDAAFKAALPKISLFNACVQTYSLGQYAVFIGAVSPKHTRMIVAGCWKDARWAAKKGKGLVFASYPSPLKTVNFEASKITAAYRTARTYRWEDEAQQKHRGRNATVVYDPLIVHFSRMEAGLSALAQVMRWLEENPALQHEPALSVCRVLPFYRNTAVVEEAQKRLRDK